MMEHRTERAAERAPRIPPERPAGPSGPLREQVRPDVLRAEYLEKNELVVSDRILAPAVVDDLAREARAAFPYAQRKHVPLYKKSGSVSHYQLLEHGPSVLRLYHDPSWIGLLEAITGARLLPCPDEDPHATAIYYYTEPGDHIGFHYDASHYAGKRFTVLVGLEDDSSSRLVCHPFRKLDPARADEELVVATRPGTVVLFNGDNIHHGVTPVGEGERRIVLTLEYVTDTSMSGFRRSVSNLKDAMTYFGFGQMLKAAFRRPK